MNENKLKLLTRVVRVSYLVTVYIIGFNISLMAGPGAVDQRVFFDASVVEFSTMNPDV